MSQPPDILDETLSELKEIEESPTVKNVLNTLEPTAQKLYNVPITVVVAILTGASFLFIGVILGYLAVIYLLVPVQVCNFLVGVFTLIGLCLGTLFAGGRWQIAKEETKRRFQEENGQKDLERIKLEGRIEAEKDQILINKLEKFTRWILETGNNPTTQEISKELVISVKESIQKQLSPVNEKNQTLKKEIASNSQGEMSRIESAIE